MTSRCPVLPPLWRFAITLSVMGCVECLAHGQSVLAMGHTWPWLLTYWVMGVGVFASGVVGLPLARALALDARPQPGWRTWVAFYLCFVVLSYPLIGLREWWLWRSGFSTDGGWAAWVVFLCQFTYVPLILGFLEHEAHFQQACRLEDLALDEARSKLAATQFKVGQVLAGERAVLSAGMNRQLKPSLARLEAQAQALDPTHLAAWAPLMEEVAGLAEREVREFSHRLHPEAIRFGLVPALEALFAERNVASRADLWVHAGAGDSPALAASPDTKATLLGVYRVVEALLALFLKEAEADAFAMVEMDWAEKGLLRFTWRGLGAWPGASSGPRDLGWSLVEARLALLGGQWAPLPPPQEDEAKGYALLLPMNEAAARA